MAAEQVGPGRHFPSPMLSLRIHWPQPGWIRGARPGRDLNEGWLVGANVAPNGHLGCVSKLRTFGLYRPPRAGAPRAQVPALYRAPRAVGPES